MRPGLARQLVAHEVGHAAHARRPRCRSASTSLRVSAISGPSGSAGAAPAGRRAVRSVPAAQRCAPASAACRETTPGSASTRPSGCAPVFPGPLAILRLVPRPKRQAGQTEIRAGEEFQRAQRDHAGEGHPRAFLARRVGVEHHHAADAFPLQTEGDAEPGLAAADDDNVVHRLAMRTAPGRHPILRRVFEQAPTRRAPGATVLPVRRRSVPCGEAPLGACRLLRSSAKFASFPVARKSRRSPFHANPVLPSSTPIPPVPARTRHAPVT